MHVCCIIHDDDCKYDMVDKLTKERKGEADSEKETERETEKKGKREICMLYHI